MLKKLITIKVNWCIQRELVFIYLVIVHRVTCSIPGPTFDKYDDWKCVPVTLEICKDVRYNETINMGFNLPNKFTEKTSQSDSNMDLEMFKPLLEAKTPCSAQLRLLICSVYIPFCSAKVPRPITACRPLCERVKYQCTRAMQTRGLDWPEPLNCDKLPERNDMDKKMCLDGGISMRSPRRQTKKPSTFIRRRKNRHRKPQRRAEKIKSRITYCRVLYLRNSRNYFFVEKLQACALDCQEDGLFTSSQKQLVERWLSALACLCGLLCVLSLAVSVFEYHNTCYPERTVVFITACYLFYSLAYIIRIIYSREGVTCNKEDGRKYLLIDGSGNLSCAATFLLTYTFSTAQNIWWVMLTFSWFLSAGLKWRPDLIRALSMYFHIFSWGVPCAMTVIILVIRKIDVNELTGICFIGNRYENLTALRAFVLGPLFTFLVMGMMFLLFGFIALFRVPSNTYNDGGSPPRKIELALLPAGMYAALHAFFSTFIFASYFYEYSNKASWYRDPDPNGGPSFEVFLMRVIMDFSIGITAAIWLLAIHLPKCLKRKLYQKSSGITHITREHTALTALKTRAEFSAIAITNMKTRVDTSETSI